MIVLGIFVSINALVGMVNETIPFYVIAYIDVITKALTGFLLLFSKKPFGIELQI